MLISCSSLDEIIDTEKLNDLYEYGVEERLIEYIDSTLLKIEVKVFEQNYVAS